MTRSMKHLMGILAAGACWNATAEDIDLFLGAQTGTGDRPQVLFVIDNTANWTQAFDNEMSALRNVFTGMTADKLEVGVMFSAETSSSDSNVQGGYVRAAIRPMSEFNKGLYGAMFTALDVGKDKGNSGQSSLVMAEAYRYLSGGAARSGNNKAKADYTGNTAADWSSAATTPASKEAMQAIYRLDGNALGSKGAETYNGPGGGSCSKQFIIYISNGPSQDSSSIISAATSMLREAGGDTTPIALPIAGSQDNVTDEWARFLNDRMGVITYTIEVNKKTSGQGPGWSSLLENMALSNGGTYQDVSTNAPDIEKAIREVLTQIQATNSVFASVSLPLSASAQGTYLNQVYVGMFRPDGTAAPRWTGNLKQYKLGYSGTDLRLQDSLGAPAVDASTGFVQVCSKSFWTKPSSYWNFRSQQFEDQAGCSVEDASFPPMSSDYPDGKFVEKGGQAQLLRATPDADRQLATCTSFECSSVKDFNVTNVTPEMLGISDDTKRRKVINWARGQDVDDEHTMDSIRPTATGTTSRAMRPSVHGDVVHSRPVALNFGTDSDPKVVVFYAANDGVFRAINGNRPSDGQIDGVAPGGELWGFVPPEFHGHFKRIYENVVPISFPNVTTGSPEPKPYAMDGAITAYRGGSKALVFATMRRGGRSVYAFDVDVDHPSDIDLAWKIGCDGSECTSSELDGLGQTWSPVKPFTAPGYVSGGTPQPLLIMGGGYDACEDAKPHTCTSSSKGNKVFVLDAATGDVERSFDTERGVVAEVAVVPDLNTGLALYAYVVDLGGNVYRIDLGEGEPDDWAMTKIASLGCDTASSGCASNRKFMFPPDILLENGAYVLLLGSGDREKPREYTSTVQNYFFMLKDKPEEGSWLASETTNCSAAVLCLNSLTPILDMETPTTEQLAAKKGWYLALNPTEQVVTSAITIFGNLTFSTHEPDTAAPAMCSANLGLARVYNISYVNAAGQAAGTQDRSAELPPDIGLPPSPVAGLVTLDDGRTVPFCIGCTSDSPLEGSEPKIPPSSLPAQPKNRVYWYIER
ncbi:MAG TPA: PilC/PilY family type IV pilus protein [Steroidobacter sp.]|uniref:pilus assembly protein n=1 Tax=Steroidobacter sp. TaxID=1978227 RepID=UPI002ED78796